MSALDWWAIGVVAYILTLPVIACALGKWLKRIAENDHE